MSFLIQDDIGIDIGIDIDIGCVLFDALAAAHHSIRERVLVLTSTKATMSKRKEASDGPLPDGWLKKVSTSSGRTYYWNTHTKKPQWDRPTSAATGGGAVSSNSSSNNSAKANKSGTTKATASHLLVKHRGSRRPSSWKEENITRTKEEAIAILRGHLASINAASDKAAKFAELARQHSDCSSAHKGGDLGEFGPGKMQKAFEDATFALDVGQISDVIESDSGVHIILRTK